MSINFSTIKDKFVADIYCVENVTIDISSPPFSIEHLSPVSREYKGNYFLIDMTTFLFFHTMNEGIAQYTMLKKIVPDLKIVPIFLSLDNSLYRSDTSFYLDIMKPFDVKIEDIIRLDQIKPTFEKLYYYTTRVNCFLEKLDIPQGKELYNRTPHFTGGYETLRELYDPYLVKDESLPKKIFLTRLEKDNFTRKLHDLSFDHDMYDVPEDKDVLQQVNNFGSRGHFDQMLREKHISREDQERLEQYFINNGYTALDPEGLTFFEQLNYYYNATHVVAMRGSALLNTIFCDPGTKIFILDTNYIYSFPYREICEIFDHEVYEIPFELKLKKYMTSELFSVKNILGILKTHYSDRV